MSMVDRVTDPYVKAVGAVVVFGGLVSLLDADVPVVNLDLGPASSVVILMGRQRLAEQAIGIVDRTNLAERALELVGRGTGGGDGESEASGSSESDGKEGG